MALAAPVVIIVEAWFFRWLANSFLAIQIKFTRLFLAAVAANLATCFVSTCISLGSSYYLAELMLLYFLLVPIVFLEWFAYLPFFMNLHIRKRDLLKIAFVVNFVTYLPFFCLIALETQRGSIMELLH
jgi:hypothetical protein